MPADENMPEPKPEDDDKAKPTGVGCILTLLTVAVIFAVAIPIVRWRDPATGQALPRFVAIFSPFLLGAAVHGIASVLLRCIGLQVWVRQEKEDRRTTDPSSARGEPRRTDR